MDEYTSRGATTMTFVISDRNDFSHILFIPFQVFVCIVFLVCQYCNTKLTIYLWSRRIYLFGNFKENLYNYICFLFSIQICVMTK